MAALAGIIGHIAGTLFSSFAIDVVGVFDANYRPVFPSARPIKANVKEDSRVMEHPLETGAKTITDYRIILPTELELSVVLQAQDYKNTYKLIKQIFLQGELLTVQTKADVYTNLLISSIPHEENPEMYDAILLAIKLKEALFVTPQFGVVPKKASNSNTVDRGNQQGKEASTANTTKSSTLYKLFS
jgi:hypothetical protein